MTQELRTTHASQRPRRRHLFALGLGSTALLLLGLGLATRPGWATAGMPIRRMCRRGLSRFWDGGQSLSGGISGAAGSVGRLIVGVTAADAVGKAVGKALADQEDRTHVHAFSGKVELPYKSISGRMVPTVRARRPRPMPTAAARGRRARACLCPAHRV